MKTLNNIVSTIIGLIIILLSLRLILRLLGANPAAGFSQFIYDTSSYFLTPFQGIFPTPTVEGAAFEFSTLFAIIIYALLGWLLTSLFTSTYRGTRRKEILIERHRIE